MLGVFPKGRKEVLAIGGEMPSQLEGLQSFFELLTLATVPSHLCFGLKPRLREALFRPRSLVFSSSQTC